MEEYKLQLGGRAHKKNLTFLVGDIGRVGCTLYRCVSNLGGFCLGSGGQELILPFFEPCFEDHGLCWKDGGRGVLGHCNLLSSVIGSREHLPLHL